jgi:hypothetical protein
VPARELDIEEATLEEEVGRYPQIHLTEVGKGRYYSYGVGDEVYQLQLVVERRPLKKLPAGMLNLCSKKEAKTTCSLSSSVGKDSPVGTFHSTSALGLKSP